MKKKGIHAAALLVLLLLAGCSLDASRLTASLFTVSVPDVVGLDSETAVKRCANAGFETEIVFVEEADVPANTVISMDPAGNTKARSSVIVKLFCAKAETAALRIPDLIGKSLDEAEDALHSQGLEVGDIKYEDSDKTKDTVILTDPLPGCEAADGSSVNLTLSSGSRKESRLRVVVELPADVETEIKLGVYVDGVLNQTKTVDPTGMSQASFTVKGTGGIKTVHVFLDGALYKSYELDFDKGLVTEE